MCLYQQFVHKLVFVHPPVKGQLFQSFAGVCRKALTSPRLLILSASDPSSDPVSGFTHLQATGNSKGLSTPSTRKFTTYVMFFVWYKWRSLGHNFKHFQLHFLSQTATVVGPMFLQCQTLLVQGATMPSTLEWCPCSKRHLQRKKTQHFNSVNTLNQNCPGRPPSLAGWVRSCPDFSTGWLGRSNKTVKIHVFRPFLSKILINIIINLKNKYMIQLLFVPF